MDLGCSSHAIADSRKEGPEASVLVLLSSVVRDYLFAERLKKLVRGRSELYQIRVVVVERAHCFCLSLLLPLCTLTDLQSREVTISHLDAAQSSGEMPCLLRHSVFAEDAGAFVEGFVVALEAQLGAK